MLVAQLCLTLWSPWTVAHQAPLSREFSKQNTVVGCHSLWPGSFPTRGLNPGLLYYKQTLYPLSHQGNPQKDWDLISISSCFFNNLYCVVLKTHWFCVLFSTPLDYYKYQIWYNQMVPLKNFIMISSYETIRGFPGGSVVKNLPVMQETWVWSLGWEDPLSKRMATHLSILAWKTTWTEEPGGIWSMGSQKSQTRLTFFHSLWNSTIPFSKNFFWIVRLDLSDWYTFTI